jgi:hypothetical protein
MKRPTNMSQCKSTFPTWTRVPKVARGRKASRKKHSAHHNKLLVTVTLEITRPAWSRPTSTQKQSVRVTYSELPTVPRVNQLVAESLPARGSHPALPREHGIASQPNRSRTTVAARWTTQLNYFQTDEKLASEPVQAVNPNRMHTWRFWAQPQI